MVLNNNASFVYKNCSVFVAQGCLNANTCAAIAQYMILSNITVGSILYIFTIIRSQTLVIRFHITNNIFCTNWIHAVNNIFGKFNVLFDTFFN